LKIFVLEGKIKIIVLVLSPICSLFTSFSKDTHYLFLRSSLSDLGHTF
jgi:hypothetical protein